MKMDKWEEKKEDEREGRVWMEKRLMKWQCWKGNRSSVLGGWWLRRCENDHQIEWERHCSLWQKLGLLFMKLSFLTSYFLHTHVFTFHLSSTSLLHLHQLLWTPTLYFHHKQPLNVNLLGLNPFLFQINGFNCVSRINKCFKQAVVYFIDITFFSDNTFFYFF